MVAFNVKCQIFLCTSVIDLLLVLLRTVLSKWHSIFSLETYINFTIEIILNNELYNLIKFHRMNLNQRKEWIKKKDQACPLPAF